MKRWWIVTFEKGLVVEAGRCKKVNSEGTMITYDPTNIDEASRSIPICLPEFQVNQQSNHSVPHIIAIDPSNPEKLEMWIVVEADSLLGAVVTATGLLVQMKNGGK